VQVHSTTTRTEPALKLWRHIFADGRGLLQVWTGVRNGNDLLEPKSSNFNYPEAANTAAQWALSKSDEGREVYFCAHLLTGAERKKKNAGEVSSLWFEKDGEGAPNGSLKPTALVQSSPGRYHGYLRLTDPIPPETAEDLNLRLAHKLDADLSGADRTQLLRVPGTVNHKYPRRPEVELVEVLEERVYSPAKLDEELPEVEKRSVPEDLGGDEAIPKGKRNETLASLAGTLRKRGFSEGIICTALLTVNTEKCKPPLEEAEVGRIAESVASYPPGVVIKAGSKSTNPSNSTNRTQPITAAELMEMEFEDTRWVVPGVLPEGLTLLVGKPKKGKSWMALGICEAVAAGGVAFGDRKVEQGDTLYLALEDNRKRLKKRLKKVLNGAMAPERMHLHTEWPRLDEGGAERLDEWLTEHSGARLVVIDTLARIRQPARGQNVYHEDYMALKALLPIAAKHGVAIVVVHHLRKMAASDPLDEISSSTGLTAGVDGFLILRRTPGSKGPTLYVDGRDIEEPTEYALHWNLNTATWTIEGDAEEVHVSKERADILLTLNRARVYMTPKEVTEALGPHAKYNNVKYLMWTMLGDGQLLKNAKGAYYPANPTNPTNPTNPANPTNPTQEAVGGLVEDQEGTNPTLSHRNGGSGDWVSGVSGVSGVQGASANQDRQKCKHGLVGGVGCYSCDPDHPFRKKGGAVEEVL
jgi:hypothetical protein